jgi:hypothetical protein
MTTKEKMNTFRTTARVVGVVLISTQSAPFYLSLHHTIPKNNDLFLTANKNLDF